MFNFCFQTLHKPSTDPCQQQVGGFFFRGYGPAEIVAWRGPGHFLFWFQPLVERNRKQGHKITVM